MKKKIKELTIAEAKRICEKFEDCTDGCPLRRLTCLDVGYLTESEMEEELEIDEEKDA